MAETTGIEWCDATWSPWEGCQKVGPGCDHCYAEGMNRWLRKGENWGPGAPRRDYSDAHWAKPLKWNAAAKAAGVRMRVFPSVCDPFDNAVDPAWRARFFDLIRETPNLDWLLLTKRIGNATDMIAEAQGDRSPISKWAAWQLPNVWLGATVVNQEEADRDIPKLLATPARVRFLSMEPLLGEVDLSQWLFPFRPCNDCPCPDPDVSREGIDRCCCDPELMPSELGWVIVGGESGPGAREFNVDWPRSLIAQCKAAGVAVHVKQLGARPVWTDADGEPPHAGRIVFRDKKGGDWTEWPEDLRVREFPEVT